MRNNTRKNVSMDDNFQSIKKTIQICIVVKTILVSKIIYPYLGNIKRNFIENRSKKHSKMSSV